MEALIIHELIKLLFRSLLGYFDYTGSMCTCTKWSAFYTATQVDGFKSLPRQATLTHFTFSWTGMLPKCTLRCCKCSSTVVPHCPGRKPSHPRGERVQGRGVSFSSAERMCCFFCLFPLLLLNLLLPKGKAAHHYPGPRLLIEERAQNIMWVAISKVFQGGTKNDTKLVPL